MLWRGCRVGGGAMSDVGLCQVRDTKWVDVVVFLECS